MTDDTKAHNSVDNLENELANLPEKFKGKTAADIAKAYSDLETAFSRQGQELGEYRRLATTLADNVARPSAEVREEKPTITADDILADPAKAIDDVIESHPAFKKARETTENLERQLAQKEFEKQHPSFREDVGDPDFQNWVRNNSSLMRLAARADAYDFEAADQLFGLWSEKKAVKQETEKKAKEMVEKYKKEREGTLEGASGADASNDVILSRAELVEIQRKALLGDRAARAKWEDPKFQAMRRRAYAAKRVQ
jgi:hypothetical protein